MDRQIHSIIVISNFVSLITTTYKYVCMYRIIVRWSYKSGICQGSNVASFVSKVQSGIVFYY